MENIDFFDAIVFKPSVPSLRLSRVHLAGIAIITIFLGVIVGYVIAKQMNLSDELASRAREVSAGPFVQVSQATMSPPERTIKELGETLPYASVTLYGKVSGYLSEILVDKGDLVKKGQLLATILSPETDSQYAAAIADAKNKRMQANRMRELFKERSVTDEERDLAVAQADMASAKVQEMGARKGYTTVTAPFDGTITARFADPGALVQDAANARSGALPIVTIAQTQRLRVTTYINQSDAAFVQVGDPAVITLSERPDSYYEARVSRKSGELDSRSRTMLTEIELDNPRNEIIPGGFVDVTLRVKMPQVIQVSSQALVMRGSAAYVAVVASDGVVHYRAIRAGENDGSTVNVLSGLEEGETVVLNMGNGLIEGQHVQMENDSAK